MRLKFRKGEKPQPGSEAYSVLDAQIVIRGDIETDGTLRVDGRLEGNILRASSVVVGPTGSILGNVQATEMVICGAVEGNIEVANRVELESTGNVVGDLSADAILVHEGGTVRGRLIVRSQAAEPAARQPMRVQTAAGEA